MITANVAIVGGGVIGCSIAWHLAAAGCRDVVVVDSAAQIGAGSTSRATGGFRVQFGSAINVRLSLLSRRKLLAFEDEVGAASGYSQAGYLFLADDDSQLQRLRAIHELVSTHGVDAMELVTPEEAQALNPAVAAGTHVGGSFCSIDGFIRPSAIAAGYAAAATRLGVRFLLSSEVISATRSDDGIGTLQTATDVISAETFVNAAGAWAANLAALLGMDSDVRPLRRLVVPTTPTEVLPDMMPMTIFLSDGFHLRVRDGRVLLLQPDAAPPGFDVAVDRAWLHQMERLKNERLPVLRTVPLDVAGAWGGLYEMSPDGHAILGKTDGVENVWVANGASGHGVMHAPAIGQLVADSILGRSLELDLHALRPSRFREHDPVIGIDLL